MAGDASGQPEQGKKTQTFASALSPPRPYLTLLAQPSTANQSPGAAEMGAVLHAILCVCCPIGTVETPWHSATASRTRTLLRPRVQCGVAERDIPVYGMQYYNVTSCSNATWRLCSSKAFDKLKSCPSNAIAPSSGRNLTHIN
jgi:hypothetical protein